MSYFSSLIFHSFVIVEQVFGRMTDGIRRDGCPSHFIFLILGLFRHENHKMSDVYSISFDSSRGKQTSQRDVEALICISFDPTNLSGIRVCRDKSSSPETLFRSIRACAVIPLSIFQIFKTPHYVFISIAYRIRSLTTLPPPPHKTRKEISSADQSCAKIPRLIYCWPE